MVSGRKYCPVRARASVCTIWKFMIFQLFFCFIFWPIEIFRNSISGYAIVIFSLGYFELDRVN